MLAASMDRVHVSDLGNGLRVGVDGHCLLHRYVVAHAKALAEAEARGQSIVAPRAMVRSILDFVKMLRNAGLQVLVVFDGRTSVLLAKQATNKRREEKRIACLREAREATIQGDERKAESLYKQSVSVTPELVHSVHMALIDPAGMGEGDDYVPVPVMISPYESDAQLAYLSSHNLIDAVITEDSDLIIYGVKRILFKMTPSGHCEQLVLSSLSHATNQPFSNWTHDQLILFACLAGCDYVSSIQGVGIKTAFKWVNECHTFDGVLSVLHSRKGLRGTSKFKNKMDAQKEKEIIKAMLVFKHQTVFCPIQLKTLPLNPLTCEALRGLEGENVFLEAYDGGHAYSFEYLGELLPTDIANELSEGKLHPYTLEPFFVDTTDPLLLTMSLDSSAEVQRERIYDEGDGSSSAGRRREGGKSNRGKRGRVGSPVNSKMSHQNQSYLPDSLQKAAGSFLKRHRQESSGIVILSRRVRRRERKKLSSDEVDNSGYDTYGIDEVEDIGIEEDARDDNNDDIGEVAEAEEDEGGGIRGRERRVRGKLDEFPHYQHQIKQHLDSPNAPFLSDNASSFFFPNKENLINRENSKGDSFNGNSNYNDNILLPLRGRFFDQSHSQSQSLSQSQSQSRETFFSDGGMNKTSQSLFPTTLHSYALMQARSNPQLKFRTCHQNFQPQAPALSGRGVELGISFEESAGIVTPPTSPLKPTLSPCATRKVAHDDEAFYHQDWSRQLHSSIHSVPSVPCMQDSPPIAHSYQQHTRDNYIHTNYHDNTQTRHDSYAPFPELNITPPPFTSSAFPSRRYWRPTPK